MKGLFKTLFLFFQIFKSKSYKTNIGSYFKSLFCISFFFFFFGFWTMPLRTYQPIKIYIHENMGRLLKLLCLKKKILFSATGNWNVCNILGIRKAKGLFKTQFLIIFFTASNPNHIKTLGLFQILFSLFMKRKCFYVPCIPYFIFAFGPCHLFRTIIIILIFR